jgi:hypothetical protein
MCFIGKTLVPDDDAAFRWRDERASEIDGLATSAHAAQEQRTTDDHVRAG